MKIQKYSAPEMEVVEVRLEQGFAQSDGQVPDFIDGGEYDL